MTMCRSENAEENERHQRTREKMKARLEALTGAQKQLREDAQEALLLFRRADEPNRSAGETGAG